MAKATVVVFAQMEDNAYMARVVNALETVNEFKESGGENDSSYHNPTNGRS